MGKVVLYGLDASPPVRACLLTLKALDLPFIFKIIDLLHGEHLRNEFLKLNPQHTVPILEDDGNIICDSHAIMAYLVGKYGKDDDTLYPKDLLKRAVVDHRLYYEAGVIFIGSLRHTTFPILFKNEPNVPQYKIDDFIKIYDQLEIFLKDAPYMAGTTMTIADFSIVSAISSSVIYVEVDANKWPKLSAWFERMQQLPYYEEANGKGAEELHELIKKKNFQIVPSE